MLTDTAIRKTKPTNKPQKLSDGKGLYVLIKPNGSKLWQMAYRFAGKQKTLSIGQYPAVTLAAARTVAALAKVDLTNGIDPSEKKQAMKLIVDTNTFVGIATEWHLKYQHTWTKNHADLIWTRLENNILPYLGKRPIDEINAPELLASLRRIENRGALETAHRVKGICGQVFRYAVATGKAERDPTADLKGALPPTKAKHHASITDPVAIGGLLRAIDGYQGSCITKIAMQLAPLVFVRPVELRHAEWSEIDLDLAEWRIPAEKMKMRLLHIVPLSQQSVALLSEIKHLTGSGRYVFPSARTNNRAMSENTVLGGLRRLGYTKEEMTGHGFRSMASTLLNEHGWHSDAIERQLAHSESNSVRAAYNYAEHLPERVKMMQSWADYLDTLRLGDNITS